MQVCEVLEERAGAAYGETKWVVSARLRDHLLLPSERKVTALWKEVCVLCGYVLTILMAKLQGRFRIQECELDFLSLTYLGGGIGARRFSN